MDSTFLPPLTKSAENISPTKTPVSNVSKTTPKSRFNFERISFILFLITIIVAPLSLITSPYVPLDIPKTGVIVFGIIISFLFYLIYKFKSSSISISRHPLILLSLGLMISALVSSFLSLNIHKSLIGQGFEITTASLFIIMFLASFLVIFLMSKDKDRVFYIYGAVISVFLIISLFHIIRFFAGPGFMSLGIFNVPTSTLIGKWNDLGILSAIVALISLAGLQFLSLGKRFKSVLTILLVLSGFFIYIVNFQAVWIGLAVVSLGIIIFQYTVYKRNLGNKENSNMGMLKFLFIPLLVLIISVVLIWKGDVLSSKIIRALNVEQTEISLPWQLTIDVAGDTIKESPIFGAGPNRFGIQYLKFKPQVVNDTQFWNTEFNMGFGLIPTFVVTQGLLGALLWFFFIILFINTGIKALRSTTDKFPLFLISSSFFVSIFLLIMTLTYVPSNSIIFFLFIFIGLFISSLLTSGNLQTREIAKSRVISISLITLVIICCIWGFTHARKAIALSNFQNGINAINTDAGQNDSKILDQNLNVAENSFKKALIWDKSDIYYQALSETHIIKINSLVKNLQSQQTPDEESVKKLSSLIEEGISYARSAIALDPTNYYNHLAEARVSEIAANLKVPNGYENTKNAYANSINANPSNPGLYLSLARFEASQNKLAEAQALIGNALELKRDYIDAIFLLSQIQVSQGKIKDAITSVQVASQISPKNPLIFFQLGLLQYNDRNYQSAVESLSKAVELDGQYANAHYFLGLSYARLGRNTEAIMQFENLAQTNPENQEIAFILSNLQEGKSPFADATPPIDNKPEQRKTLPIKEPVKEKTSTTSKTPTTSKPKSVK